MSAISSILHSVQKGFLKDILVGAGVTLGSMAISYTVFDSAIEKYRDKVLRIDQDLLSMAHLAGFDIFMTNVLAAILTALTLKYSRLGLKKL